MSGRANATVRERLRLLFPGRNPLARRCDRIEARCVIALLVVACAALPGALAAGLVTAHEVGARIDAQRESRTQVQATLMDDAVGGAGDPAGRVVVPSTASARWTDVAGRPHSGVVEVPYGA